LSSENWFIFIERKDASQIRYGVFTYFRLPTAIPLHEGITIDPNRFCLLLRKVSASTIEIIGAKGNRLTLIFSTIRGSSPSTEHITNFAASCCKGLTVSGPLDDFQTYLTRLIESALATSHGTILICAQDGALSSVPALKDAVPVDPLLDFNSAFAEFKTAGTAGSILPLQRSEELFKGFLRCDGMIVFDTMGRITSYRVFYQPQNEEPAIQSVVGGARRRAYEGVKTLVGRPLMSVLFRSQDGLTLFHGEGT
jgi:hypothetical protein